MASTGDMAMLLQHHRQKLPESNVVEHILLALRHITTNSEFLPALQVNKEWNFQGQAILHGAIVLTNTRFARFVDSVQVRPGRFNAIKSLTVRLRLGMPGSVGHSVMRAGGRSTEQLLVGLAGIIDSNMHELQAFSLYIEDEPIGDSELDGIISEPRIRAEALISLLKALPTSCTSLEFDTAGFEVYRGDDHICPWIAKLIPRLCHLRLRLGRLCPAFIGAPRYESCEECPDSQKQPTAPHLKTLTVNMELSKVVIENSTRCSFTQPVPGNRPEDDDSTERLQTEITQELRTCLTRKYCFPVVQKLEVFGPVAMDVPPYNHLRQADILASRTHILISMPLCGFEGGEWKAAVRRCIRTKDGGEIIDTWTTARERLEAAWLTTYQGVRLPCAAKTKKNFLSGTRLHLAWEYHFSDSLPDYIYRNTRPRLMFLFGKTHAQALDETQSSLKEIDIADSISRTFPTLRAVSKFQFRSTLPGHWDFEMS